MDKKIITITENDLHRIIKESVKKILKERHYGSFGSDDADPEDMYDWWPKKETDNEKVDRLYDERND
jgi:hypothetical protein